MKFKTTRKAVVNGYRNVKYAGYCDLWHLLKNHEPIAYTSGIYGWNFDLYDVYGVAICTGYRNMPGERLEQIHEYETEARIIYEDYNTPFETRSAAIEMLLKDFCELNGGYKND